MVAEGLAGFLLIGLAAAEPSHHVLDPGRSGARLDPAIASPERFLGFEVGERPIRHDELLRYFEYLAQASDRADLARYGQTPGGRDLVSLTISEPEHLRDRETIRSQRRRVAADPGADAGLTAKLPAAVWIGFGIHGDELSSSDAAVMLAYRLTAGEDPAIAGIRRNLVVTVDPMYNPDGRARALGHVGAFRRRQPALDHQDISHHPFWPGGRGNHYFFDLNRDALYQVQEQSRDRVRAILAADPQLLVDAHEMDWDDTYHFGLPNEPLNPHIPDEVHQSWAEFARDLGAAFDAIGRSWYTRSWNEVFYPGFYEIWPTYFGVTAILYEQASTFGQAVLKSNDKVLDFRTAVGNHFRSSMATLVAAAGRKSTLIERWASVQSDGKRGRSAGAQKSWVVLPDDGYKQRELLRILLAQDVGVQALTAPVRARGLHSWRQDDAEERLLPAGTLRIDVAQARARLIRNIFDFHVPMSAAFLAHEK
ncbi:MAG: M14 family zinc carboxypeptidase, partial [Steroidobacteraceae bacterium]